MKEHFLSNIKAFLFIPEYTGYQPEQQKKYEPFYFGKKTNNKNQCREGKSPSKSCFELMMKKKNMTREKK